LNQHLIDIHPIPPTLNAVSFTCPSSTEQPKILLVRKNTGWAFTPFPLPLTSSYAYVVVCLAKLSRLGRIYTLCSFGHGTCPDLRTDDVIPVHDDAQLHTAHRTRSAGKRWAFCHSVRILRPAIFICFPP
jgi:hypothetical protein